MTQQEWPFYDWRQDISGSASRGPNIHQADLEAGAAERAQAVERWRQSIPAENTFEVQVQSEAARQQQLTEGERTRDTGRQGVDPQEVAGWEGAEAKLCTDFVTFVRARNFNGAQLLTHKERPGEPAWFIRGYFIGFANDFERGFNPQFRAVAGSIFLCEDGKLRKWTGRKTPGGGKSTEPKTIKGLVRFSSGDYESPVFEEQHTVKKPVVLSQLVDGKHDSEGGSTSMGVRHWIERYGYHTESTYGGFIGQEELYRTLIEHARHATGLPGRPPSAYRYTLEIETTLNPDGSVAHETRSDQTNVFDARLRSLTDEHVDGL